MSEIEIAMRGIISSFAKISFGFLFISACHILVQHLGFPKEYENWIFVFLTTMAAIKLKMEIKWL